MNIVLTALPTVDFKNVDVNGLKTDIVNILMDNIASLLQGGASDLANFVSKIAEDYVNILADDTTDPTVKAALIAELTAEMKLVGEINRIRAEQVEWATIIAVTNAILKVGATIIKFPPV